MFKDKITRWDIIITLAMMVISLSCYIFFVRGNAGTANNEICVYIDGDNVSTLFLDKDGEYSFLNGEFVISIKNSAARVVNSDCYDRTCCDMTLNKNGGEIICLPNKIVIRPKENKTASVSTDLYAG